MIKSCILFLLGGIAATAAVYAAARCPKTRELWEKGMHKGKQAKEKALNAFQQMKEGALKRASEAKEKLAEHAEAES